MLTVNLKKAYDDAAIIEALKSIRANIEFCGDSYKCLSIVSSVPGEGKSSTSYAVASAFAEAGKKVIFIDADLRRSNLRRYCVESVPIHGLTYYLSGQSRLEQIVCETNIPNMHIIFSGPQAPNPAELLSSRAFANLVQALKTRYDYVFIDTPPLINVIDAAVLSKICDGAILVVEAHKTKYRLTRELKIQLEKAGCNIIGVILNKVSFRSSPYKYIYKAYE